MYGNGNKIFIQKQSPNRGKFEVKGALMQKITTNDNIVITFIANLNEAFNKNEGKYIVKTHYVHSLLSIFYKCSNINK